MAKNQLSLLLATGKRLACSETVRTIGQILFACAVFAALYLFLITGFALGMTM